MKVWTYVITTDRGSAPNYGAPATTLTICKPRIRRAARPGELVLAFNGRPLSVERNSVRWAGIISEVMSLDDYWQDARFASKRPGRSPTPDNIYFTDEGGLWIQVPNMSHDDRHMTTDLRGKNALIFCRTWRMGDSVPILPDVFGLWITGNRRQEPQHDISSDMWLELEAWLDAMVVPSPPQVRPGGSCRSRPRQTPSKPARPC